MASLNRTHSVLVVVIKKTLQELRMMSSVTLRDALRKKNRIMWEKSAPPVWELPVLPKNIYGYFSFFFWYKLKKVVG